MKRYEGLFILNNTAREEGIKESVDKIVHEIEHAGGKVEGVQKMDKRPFTRVANKKFNSGFFVNIIFSARSESLDGLRHRFAGNEEIFRATIFLAPPEKPAAMSVPQ